MPTAQALQDHVLQAMFDLEVLRTAGASPAAMREPQGRLDAVLQTYRGWAYEVALDDNFVPRDSARQHLAPTSYEIDPEGIAVYWQLDANRGRRGYLAPWNLILDAQELSAET